MDNTGLQEGHMFDIDEGLKTKAAEAARSMIADGRTFAIVNINGNETNGSLTISTEKDKFMAFDTIEIDGTTVYIGIKND